MGQMFEEYGKRHAKKVPEKVHNTKNPNDDDV